MSRITAKLTITGLAKKKMSELEAFARHDGLSPEMYAKKLIEEQLKIQREARERSFADIMAPVRDEFRASRMTEADLDRLVDQARTGHHRRVSGKKR